MGGAIQLVTAEVTEPPDGCATDDDLVSLATQGNRAAFEALLRRHYDLMHRVAWRMTGSQTDAQDICQDVCCALVGRIASFRGEAKFTTWLVGIVRNACHDHHRRHSLGSRSSRSRPFSQRNLRSGIRAVPHRDRARYFIRRDWQPNFRSDSIKNRC